VTPRNWGNGLMVKRAGALRALPQLSELFAAGGVSYGTKVLLSYLSYWTVPFLPFPSIFPPAGQNFFVKRFRVVLTSQNF
jgi:hypothetical protein